MCCIGHTASYAEKLQEIVKLAMDISTNSYWCSNRLNVRLCELRQSFSLSVSSLSLENDELSGYNRWE